MPTYDLPHIDIGSRRLRRDYQDRQRDLSGLGVPRTREEHGARIRQQLLDVLQRTDDTRPAREELGPRQGTYVEIELERGKHPEKTIERKSRGMHPGAVNSAPNDADKVVLYVPDAARAILEEILNNYTDGPLTPGGRPQQQAFVEPIEEIRQALLTSFWTDDPDQLPTDPDDEIWWELWCFPGTEDKTVSLIERLGGRIADQDLWMRFPEAIVIPVYANRASIELLMFAPFSLLELRRASADPNFFTDTHRDEQYQWAEHLAERTIWPGTDVPAICLFDTGVNRAHALIEPALSADDLLAAREAWGGDDSEGHGTQMAGLSLHGDLTPRLLDDGEHPLEHRLESVKLLPPRGFAPNHPNSLGAITQSGVARSEINAPERHRVFCMAITNRNVSGARSSTWSAAIDQAAAGVMPGDDEQAPKRLFIVSTGNVPAEIERHRLRPNDAYPVEDPSQSWNAITVGGYTDKLNISEPDLVGYTPYAAVGELSPFSRTSDTWPAGKSPYKPDLVMEAGNRALSPDEQEVYSTDSLSLLTTGSDVDRLPLTAFAATSAAAAQAARLAARLSVRYPEYWPETIRALMVHSAEYTPAMRDQIEDQGGLRDRYAYLRRYGYGVPAYERAAFCAQSHVALVTQATLQPYARDGGKKFKDCHFYALPWPRSTLEALGELTVRLKVTLSYFVEPNPGVSASMNPQRYQSFGLRFELRRPLESRENFVKRVNVKEREHPQERVPSADEDGRWTFGPRSISAGSLHCDEWVGPAAMLANRDLLCIKPVAGWWRDRASKAIAEQQARYALVVTLQTDDEAVELHTRIEQVIENEVGIEIPIRVDT